MRTTAPTSRSRTSSSTATTDGLVDDHVPLNRIVVINPDVVVQQQPHNSSSSSSGGTTTTDEDEDDIQGDVGPSEASHSGDDGTAAAATEDGVTGMTAKFIESSAAAASVQHIDGVDVTDHHPRLGMDPYSHRVTMEHHHETSSESSDGDNAAVVPRTFAFAKGIAEGMMDIALLTANANQLRFLITYNTESKTFYVSVGLIVASLIIQVAVGIALIFKSQMKIRGHGHKASKTNDFLVGGVFIVTVINVFAAAFTTTDKEVN